MMKHKEKVAAAGKKPKHKMKIKAWTNHWFLLTKGKITMKKSIENQISLAS